jgi:YHS domain-containing protein
MKTIYLLLMMVVSVSSLSLTEAEFGFPESAPRRLTAQSRGEAVVPLEGLDPVLLVEGKEAQGEETFAATRGRFRYLFANAANKAAFERDPARYEIQLGGTCARMGPNTLGDPDLYLVHQGRIYLFGSPECLKLFKASPEKFLDAGAAAKTAPPSADALRRGRALVEKAVEAAGGAQRIDRLKSYRESGVTQRQGRDGVTDVKTSLVRVFPASYRQERLMPFGTLATVVTPADAFYIAGRNTGGLIEVQREAFEKSQKLTLLSVLRARTSDGFTAAATGTAGGVESVEVSFEGVWAKLGVEASSGRVVSLAYRGRGPGGELGEITQTFSDFRAAGGLTLPFKAAGAFNGRPEPTLSYTLDQIVTDGDVDAALFERPKPAPAGQ